MRSGLCLSGGGLRATLFHIGVLRNLRERGILPTIKTITSVSGGSITAAHLVQNWDEYCNGDFDKVTFRLLNMVRKDIRGRITRKYLPIAPAYILLRALSILDKYMMVFNFSTMADYISDLRIKWLQYYYHHYLFKCCCRRYYRNKCHANCKYKHTGTYSDLVNSISQPPNVYLLATDVSEGKLHAYTHEGLRIDITKLFDYDDNFFITSDSINLADAVAASSAFPAMLPTKSVDHNTLKF